MTSPAKPSRVPGALADASVVVTRPRERAESLVRALRQRGATVLRLPAQSVLANAAFDWPAALRRRSAMQAWIFTSPAAVAHARALIDAGLDGQTLFAVGAATAAALRRHRLHAIAPLLRQDSEGLLALPGLADVDNRRIAIVGAPDGRGLIAATLRERGAEVDEWSVYRRGPAAWHASQLAAIDAAPNPLRVVLSSTQSLRNLRDHLPATTWQRLRDAGWIASSERLADALRESGACDIVVAASASGADLVAATLHSLKR